MKRLLASLLLLLAALPCFASGPYYVRNDGSNNNTGLANTSGAAWHDIKYFNSFKYWP